MFHVEHRWRLRAQAERGALFQGSTETALRPTLRELNNAPWNNSLDLDVPRGTSLLKLQLVPNERRHGRRVRRPSRTYGARQILTSRHGGHRTQAASPHDVRHPNDLGGLNRTAQVAHPCHVEKLSGTFRRLHHKNLRATQRTGHRFTAGTHALRRKLLDDEPKKGLSEQISHLKAALRHRRNWRRNRNGPSEPVMELLGQPTLESVPVLFQKSPRCREVSFRQTGGRISEEKVPLLERNAHDREGH